MPGSDLGVQKPSNQDQKESLKYLRNLPSNGSKSIFGFFFNSLVLKRYKQLFLMPGSGFRAQISLSREQKGIMKYLRNLPLNDQKSIYWFFLNSLVWKG